MSRILRQRKDWCFTGRKFFDFVSFIVIVISIKLYINNFFVLFSLNECLKKESTGLSQLGTFIILRTFLKNYLF